MSILLSLKVLMWKNFIIRRRHWVATLIQILAPVLLFMCQPLLLPDKSKPLPVKLTYNPQRSLSDMYTLFDPNFTILYSPVNNFTLSLIEGVQVLLKVDDRNVRGFLTKDTLFSYFMTIKNVTEKIMGINFLLDLDNIFEYVIKPYQRNVNWQFKLLYYLRNTARPGTGSYNYVHNGFLPLQMAIDASYLKIKFNKSVQVFVEEFPFPNYNASLHSTFTDTYTSLTVVSFIFVCQSILQRMVEDKSSGAKELMQVMGIPRLLIFVGWFLYELMVSIITTAFITVFLKYSVWTEASGSLKRLNFVILYLFLISYNVAAIAFCLAIGSVFSNPFLAQICGLTAWLLSYFFPIGYWNNLPSSGILFKIFVSFFPNGILYFGYSRIVFWEEVGFKWGHLKERVPVTPTTIPLTTVLAIFLFEIIMYTIIALYLDEIHPGPYGISKAAGYHCERALKKIFNFPINKRNSKIDGLSRFIKIEKDTWQPIGIGLVNLTKTFDNTTVVSNLSVDIYKNEITVLIGNTGAGKSVIMSIIEGLIDATNGQVLVHGRDVKYHSNEIRKSLGVCFQNDLLFTELTVLEHLLFFGMLRGLSKTVAYEKSWLLINSFNMCDQRNFFPFQLSPAMKRKLSLSIALIGDSKVLLLDEPINGLDSKSREIAWGILSSLKESRIILLSTQYVEEINRCVDRVAVLNHGRLMCFGTQEFLKQQYGYDYQLLVRFNYKEHNASIRKDVVNTVKSVIPSAKINYENRDCITFRLPLSSKTLFPNLLKILEENLNRFHIVHMEFSSSTLQQVYSRINNVASTKQSETLDIALTSKDIQFGMNNKLHGRKKIIPQILVLFKKRYWIEKRQGFTNFLTICSIIFLTLLTLYCSDLKIAVLTCLKLNLKVYSSSKVYYSVKDVPMHRDDWEIQYLKVLNEFTNKIAKVEQVHEELLKEGRRNIQYYKTKLMVATQINGSLNENVVINAMYSSNSPHAAPISYSIALNTAIKSLIKADLSIRSSNCPFPIDDVVHVKFEKYRQHWHIIFSLAILCYTGKFLILPINEELTASKHLQLISGVHTFLYWIVNYICDFIMFSIATLAVLLVITLYGIFRNCMFCEKAEIEKLSFILMAFGGNIIIFSYLTCHIFKRNYSVFQFILLNIFLGIVLSSAVLCLMAIYPNFFIYDILNLFPQYWLSMSIHYFYLHTRNKHSCNIDKVVGLMDAPQSCTPDPRPYVYSEVLTNIFLIFFSTIFYLVILIALEVQTILKLRRRFVSASPANENHENQQTALEPEDDISGQNPQNDSQNIQNTSLTIKTGECVGLLGVDGHGKTTIFRVFTTDELLATGDIRISYSDQLFYISTNSEQYFNTIGYCPQDDAISDCLTARETFYIFAKIRGVSERVDELISMWLNILELTDISETAIKDYIKKDKRKVCVGIALIGSPLIIVLDEPTFGIDLRARQRIWTLLNLLSHESYIFVSSQNAIEYEALCDYVCIIKHGRIKYHRKLVDIVSKCTKAFSVKLNLNRFVKEAFEKRLLYSESISSLFLGVDNKTVIYLIGELNEKYNAAYRQKAYTNGLLSFIIEKDFKWVKIFEDLEYLKNQHTIIEDYEISTISLEDGLEMLE